MVHLLVFPYPGACPELPEQEPIAKLRKNMTAIPIKTFFIMFRPFKLAAKAFENGVQFVKVFIAQSHTAAALGTTS